MTEPLDEDSLIRLASAGDSAALAILLETHEARLMHYAKRRLPQGVGGYTSAEDIVQETNYEACRMIRAFVPQGPHSFYRWLLRIARHRVQGVAERFRTRRTHAISGGLTEDASILTALEHMKIYRRTPSLSAAGHEFVAQLEQALERINPNYRQVIVYRFLDGLTVPETAQRMNRTDDQTYVLCCRALRALREHLASISHFV